MSKKQIAREIGKAKARGDFEAANAWRLMLKYKAPFRYGPRKESDNDAE